MKTAREYLEAAGSSLHSAHAMASEQDMGLAQMWTAISLAESQLAMAIALADVGVERTAGLTDLQLGAKLGVFEHAAHTLCERMQRKGWVRRVPTPHGTGARWTTA